MAKEVVSPYAYIIQYVVVFVNKKRCILYIFLVKVSQPHAHTRIIIADTQNDNVVSCRKGIKP